MAKPIFILKVPEAFSPMQYEHIKTILKRDLPDYSRLIIPHYDGNEIKYDVLNVEQMEPLRYDELIKELNEIAENAAPHWR